MEKSACHSCPKGHGQCKVLELTELSVKDKERIIRELEKIIAERSQLEITFTN